MDWRIVLLAAVATPFAGVVVLAVINRRTLAGDRTDDLGTQGAEEGGRAFIQHANGNTDA